MRWDIAAARLDLSGKMENVLWRRWWERIRRNSLQLNVKPDRHEQRTIKCHAVIMKYTMIPTIFSGAMPPARLGRSPKMII